MNASAASDFDANLLSAKPSDVLASLTKAGPKAPALVEAWVKSGNAAAVAEAADASVAALPIAMSATSRPSRTQARRPRSENISWAAK